MALGVTCAPGMWLAGSVDFRSHHAPLVGGDCIHPMWDLSEDEARQTAQGWIRCSARMADGVMICLCLEIG